MKFRMPWQMSALAAIAEKPIMSKPETRTVRLWQIGATDLAYRYHTMPPGMRGRESGNRQVWIPKSIIHHVSREPKDVDGSTPCNVEVEEWWLTKNEL